MKTLNFLAGILLAASCICLTSCNEKVNSPLLTGCFSVSTSKQVRFSRGNLQYTRSTNTWSFAEHQYDFINTSNVTGGIDYTEQGHTEYHYYKEGTGLSDKIDLFGWIGSTGCAKWGISTSEDDNDYSGDFADWGRNIGDGNTWYTLTSDEWGYLLSKRTNAGNLIGVARIKLNADGTQFANDLVLLPDNWACPNRVTFKSGIAADESGQAYADYQTFTLTDWRKLEVAGAVFLPAAGYRLGAGVGYAQHFGGYWSATPRAAVSFRSNLLTISHFLGPSYGFPVRLVQDIK